MTQTPVVMIAFNRPDVTARNLEVLRTARPSRLLLICDGPRADRPDDAERTAAVRSILDRVDWPAEVQRRYSTENLGCEANVELGLDWAFSQVERAIVLEDDCLADRTFFTYCGELLDRFADDQRIWHLAGNSLDVPAGLFGSDSYAFSTWASVWGWATWADRWQHHRTLFPRDHALRPDGTRSNTPVRTSPPDPLPGTLVTPGAEKHFADAATSLDVVTHGWDKQWWLSIMSQGGLSVTPALNLVENVGFGASATHGVAERRLEPAHAMPFPLHHPAEVALDAEIERELELVLNRVGGRAAQLARRLIRWPALRKLVRRVVASRVVASAMRTWSRRTARPACNG